MVKEITPVELEQIVSDPKGAVFIDVRSPEECAEGMVKGAININLFDPNFMEEVSKLDKNKDYYMICRSGGRSGSACGAMDQIGFTSVTNMVGGMLAWSGEVVYP